MPVRRRAGREVQVPATLHTRPASGDCCSRLEREAGAHAMAGAAVPRANLEWAWAGAIHARGKARMEFDPSRLPRIAALGVRRAREMRRAGGRPSSESPERVPPASPSSESLQHPSRAPLQRASLLPRGAWAGERVPSPGSPPWAARTRRRGMAQVPRMGAGAGTRYPVRGGRRYPILRTSAGGRSCLDARLGVRVRVRVQVASPLAGGGSPSSSNSTPSAAS